MIATRFDQMPSEQVVGRKIHVELTRERARARASSHQQIVRVCCDVRQMFGPPQHFEAAPLFCLSPICHRCENEIVTETGDRRHSNIDCHPFY